MQALIAVQSAPEIKKAVIRRKNAKGTLSITSYDVRKIRDGKATDPGLEPGDMVELVG